MNNPLVSIPIITYNGERYLRRQLDSIYRQTYRNIEVVACDDGSTDATPAILEEYRSSHGLRYIINPSNLGYLRNFEKAVSLCAGEFIVPSDQDDIWLPEKIESLIGIIGDKSIACSDAILIDENDNTVAESAIAFSNLSAPRSGKPFRQLLFSSFVIGCTALYSRDLIQRALPIPEGELYHDWWMSLVASTMKGISYYPKPLILYRKHPANSIGLKKDASLFGKIFGFLYTPPERERYRTQEKRLRTISGASQFTSEQKHLLHIAQLFYADRSKPGIHPMAFAIALKYHQSIFPWTSGVFRIKAIFGCLLR
jgi:glycosyltransferase involved in cell wall biosynthesis